MGACGPPGASRCYARTSLRAPSRPHPPLRTFVLSDLATALGHVRPGSDVRHPSNVQPRKQNRAKRVLKRGVGAGRSAQRGTSAATTGPRGARSAPPNPEIDILVFLFM